MTYGYDDIDYRTNKGLKNIVNIFVNQISKSFLVILVLIALLNNSTAQNEFNCNPTQDYGSIGIEQQMNGNFEKAIESFDCAISLEDTNSENYSFRGIVYLGAGSMPKAMEDFTKAIELDDTVANYYFLRGLAYYLMQDYENAIGDLASSIELDPTISDYYLVLTLAYVNLEDFEVAEDVLSQAIESNDDNAEMFAIRGYFYYLMEKFDESEEDFTASLNIDTAIATNYFEKAVVYDASNILQIAVVNYSIAILIQPDFVEAYRQRAVSYIELEKNNLANGDIDRAYKIDNDPEHYAFIGFAYYFLGDLENSWINLQIFEDLVGKDNIEPITLDTIKSLEEALISE